MKILETERLTLGHLGVEDDEFILEILNEPSFLRFIGDRGVRDRDRARRYILEGPVASYERFGFGLYRTALKETDTPIGICGLVQRDYLDDPDVGFAFLPAYWSAGYAFESAAAVVRHERETLGLKRVLAIVSADNQRSIRLLERLGLRFEKRIRLDGEESEVKLFTSDPPRGEE